MLGEALLRTCVEAYVNRDVCNVPMSDLLVHIVSCACLSYHITLICAIYFVQSLLIARKNAVFFLEFA